jgi:hypothetical protein
LCFYALPNPAAPVNFPANYPVEQFYFAITGVANGIRGARVLWHSALEASFVGGEPAAGKQMVFTRYRIKLTGLVDGELYTITHPYGSKTYRAGHDPQFPGWIQDTVDIGAGLIGNFTAALKGNVGPFLLPTALAGRAPGTYIADPLVDTTVTGSPYGTNFVRVDGPGLSVAFPAYATGPNSMQFDLFTMQGQIAIQGGVQVNDSHVTKTATETAVNVWADAPPGSSIEAATNGGIPVAMKEIALTDRGAMFFGRMVLPTGTDPTSMVLQNLTDAPATTFTQTVFQDLLTVPSAVHMVGSDIFVNAASSIETATPAMSVTGLGLGTANLTLGLNGVASGTLTVPATAVPPKEVVVTSAAGGRATIPVLVKSAPAVTANAGLDLAVAAGASVTLNATGSAGPITSYAWTHDGGAALTLVGANTANPTFVAPSSFAPSVLTFSLTVAGAFGQTATDTVVINVAADPNIPPPTPVFALAGPDQSATAGALVSLDGSASTGQGLIFAWTHDAGAAITLLGADTATPSFTAPSLFTASIITLTLTVRDAIGTTATDSVIVSVPALPPPPVFANAGLNQNAAAGALVNLSGINSSGPITSFAWSQTAGPAVVLSGANLGNASFTAPSLLVPSILTFSLTVTGAFGQSSSASVSVSVAAIPPIPLVANAGPNQNVAAGAQVLLDASASVGTIVSWQWTQTAGPAVAINLANAAVANFAAPNLPTQSILTFSVALVGEAGQTASASVTVTVAPAVPTVTDVVTITRAQYIVSTNSWRLQGSAQQRRAQAITIYVGAPGTTTRRIGSAQVGANGLWSLNTAKFSGPAPAAFDTQVWAESSLGGTIGVFTFTRG